MSTPSDAFYTAVATPTPPAPHAAVPQFDIPTRVSISGHRRPAPRRTIADLIAECVHPGHLPNPLGSPGCSPVLRAILELSLLPFTVVRELASDGDRNGHAGGNAIDVDGDDDPLLLATFLRQVPQLFACALWVSDAPDDGLYVLNGVPTDPSAFPAAARAAYADTLHLSSSRGRLRTALQRHDVAAVLAAGRPLT